MKTAYPRVPRPFANRQIGGFYELMIIFFLPVYVYAGYFVGDLFGLAFIGAIAGFFIGLPMIALVLNVDYLGTGLLAVLGLGGSFLAPDAWRGWILLLLCVLPVLRRLPDLPGMLRSR